MTWQSALIEFGSLLATEYPDALMLTLIAVGGFYELHYGTVAKMAEKQYTLAAAVYALLNKEDGLDEGQFRDDMWEDDNARTYPGDFEEDNVGDSIDKRYSDQSRIDPMVKQGEDD
jgi:hypothetical protein